MLIHPGNHIGDTWYYVEKETIHCFYLTCPESVPRHTAWDIGHATSSNLVDWTVHELALRKGEPGAYDAGCLATGSVIRFQGRYWLAYTAAWNGPRPAVALAVSDDLFRWEKMAYNPVTWIEPAYYDEAPLRPARRWPHWRDPFLFQYEGAVYHYVCANTNRGPLDGRGTVGLAKSADMVQWEVLPPPEVAPVCTELECPQVYGAGGRYYLLFSAMPAFFSEAFQAQYGPELRSSSYAMVGQTPFGPFQSYGSGQIIPPDYPLSPYANQIVFWQGKPYLLGTVWNDQQDFVCEPIPVEFTEQGIRVEG